MQNWKLPVLDSQPSKKYFAEEIYAVWKCGIGITMTIDWQKFYRVLDRMTIQIPEPDPADPDQLHDIMRLFVTVNNKRMILDKTMRKLERRLGATRNDIVVYEERLKIERAEYMHQGNELALCKNKDERNSMLDLLTRSTSARLASLRADKANLMHARDAVESTMNTLKSSKETLNGMKTILLTEMENV